MAMIANIDSDIFLSMTLNERLKALRLEKGVGQAEIAAVADVAIPTVSEWETGKKSPKRKNLVKLAEYFDVTLDYLVQGIELKDISQQEESLIKLYRKAPEALQGAVFTILSNVQDDNSNK